jgi:hypothetical protein
MKKQKSSKPKHQTTPHAYVARVEELEPATDSTPYAGRLKRKLDELRDGRCLICVMICKRDNAIRERDEWAAMCGRYKQERDEAREQISKLRYIAEKAIEYGEKNHNRSCDAISYGGGCECDCGIEALFAELDQLKEEVK